MTYLDCGISGLFLAVFTGLFTLGGVASAQAQNVMQPTAVITTSMWDNPGLAGHKAKMINASGFSGGVPD